MKVLKHIKEFGWAYAIIEIVLITVGILMAIQIDTWKESYKERKQEIKMLSEIKSSLEQDRDFLITLIIPRSKEVVTSSEALMNHIKFDDINDDSLQDRVFKITYGIEFEPRTSAFENLKTTDVNLISSDSLRLRIVELYDFLYDRQLRIIDNVINDYREKHLLPYIISKLEYQVDIKDGALVRDESGQIITKLLVPDDVLYDKEFFNILSSRYWHFSDIYFRLTRLEKKVQSLIDEIELELSRLN